MRVASDAARRVGNVSIIKLGGTTTLLVAVVIVPAPGCRSVCDCKGQANKLISITGDVADLDNPNGKRRLAFIPTGDDDWARSFLGMAWIRSDGTFHVRAHPGAYRVELYDVDAPKPRAVFHVTVSRQHSRLDLRVPRKGEPTPMRKDDFPDSSG